MARILFYLPVVTPWWFDNIVAPLIRSLAASSEVHVLVPPLWRNTGVGPVQVEGCSSIPSLQWHIVNDPSHHSLRTYPAHPDGVVEFVQSLAPDYVFCRSADIVTPGRFPGQIIHLMEAGASPLSTPATWIILQRDFWCHGAMPVLSEEEREAVRSAFFNPWKRMLDEFDRVRPFSLPRSTVLSDFGLPPDRKIIALPLEYENPEAFTRFHNRFERNLDLIRYVVEELNDEYVLAITDHPLNCKYLDNSDVYSAIEALGARAHLVPNTNANNLPTDLLIKSCDGLIVQNTKAIYSGAFFGKPTLRLSNRPTAEWLGAHDKMSAFLAQVTSGAASAAFDQAQLWFGFHLMHEVIDPATISGAEILCRADQPFSLDRLATGLARFEAHQRALDKAA